MKKYARIENGQVAEIFETAGDIAQMFHPSLMWIECDAEVAVGWSFDGAFYEAPNVDAITHVPQSVSMRQAREALIRRGHIAAVDDYIAAIPGIEGEIARNEWNRSQVVERNRPLTLAMAQIIGLDVPDELDELFIYAVTL